MRQVSKFGALAARRPLRSHVLGPRTTCSAEISWIAAARAKPPSRRSLLRPASILHYLFSRHPLIGTGRPGNPRTHPKAPEWRWIRGHRWRTQRGGERSGESGHPSRSRVTDSPSSGVGPPPRRTTSASQWSYPSRPRDHGGRPRSAGCSAAASQTGRSSPLDPTRNATTYIVLVSSCYTTSSRIGRWAGACWFQSTRRSGAR